MIEDHELKAYRGNVATTFAAGMPFLPYFTLHGAEHIDEVDRICLLLASSIPSLCTDKSETNLARLALILHDRALVDVGSKVELAEIAGRMGPLAGAAEVVRKTHAQQVRSVVERRAEGLRATFSRIEQHEVDAATTIASFHSGPDLGSAPAHLRGLCALVRLVDELDIGPSRAPTVTYCTLREHMDMLARFHWLKHMVACRIRRGWTFFEEVCNGRTTLRLSVAVSATERTWQCIQRRIFEKLRRCLEDEEVGAIIRDEFGVRVELAMAEETPSLCGVGAGLVREVREDLDALVGTKFCPGDGGLASDGSSGLAHGKGVSDQAEEQADDVPSVQPAVGPRSEGPVSRSGGSDTLRIFAVPADELPGQMCRSGRLTVIDNTYVLPRLQSAGGVEGAPNLIYVGPADCGKTRAATEWVMEITRRHRSSWVVLRTDTGRIPDNVDDIVFNTSRYDDPQHAMPQNAILFVDDLPLNLPEPRPGQEHTEAVRRLFQWFSNYPGFRERRVVGTVRLEDAHGKPGWPEVLPSLMSELELIRVVGIRDDDYRKLWEGMAQGTVSRSEFEEERSYTLKLSDDFLAEVTKRETNPEAVASFIRGEALSSVNEVREEDAAKFRESAVENWLGNEWRAILRAFGMHARVFFTLARFLEAGLRPGSGFKVSLSPAREYHETFGPDLCEENGASGDEYLDKIRAMARAGHLAGPHEGRVRPRWDYVLQAEALPGVEVALPTPAWFAERSLALPVSLRGGLAAHLTAAGLEVPEDVGNDDAWLLGCGTGKGLLADAEGDPARQAALREEAVEAYRKAVAANDKNDRAWTMLGFCLGQQAVAQGDPARKVALLDDAVQASRKAVEVNDAVHFALAGFAYSLACRIGAEGDSARRDALLGELRTLAAAHPDEAPVRGALAMGLVETLVHARDEGVPARQAALLDEIRRFAEASPDSPLIEKMQAAAGRIVRLLDEADEEAPGEDSPAD